MKARQHDYVPSRLIIKLKSTVYESQLLFVTHIRVAVSSTWSVTQLSKLRDTPTGHVSGSIVLYFIFTTTLSVISRFARVLRYLFLTKDIPGRYGRSVTPLDATRGSEGRYFVHIID